MSRFKKKEQNKTENKLEKPY